MKAIQIAIVHESENFYPSCVALGEDGRIFLKSLMKPNELWTELKELPDKEKKQ